MNLQGANICIVMLSALGDTVHVLPIVCALKRHAPTSRITWVLEPAGASLMRGHPLVDEIVVHRRGFSSLRSLRSRLGSSRFDLLIDLQVAFKAGLAAAMIPARVKLGFDRERARDLNWLFSNERIPPHEPQHVQDQYIEFLTHLGVPVEPIEWQLGPWPGEALHVARILEQIARPAAALVLATSRKEKDWFAERWVQLADALYENHGLQPVLIGGSTPKETAIAEAILRSAHYPVISTLGCSLRELVGVLGGCALVVSPDTAPLHLSVALGVPVLALMGYTNPRRVGPYRAYHDLLVDHYGNSGERYVASLEYRPGRMETISVRDVLDKVRVWESRYRVTGARTSPPTGAGQDEPGVGTSRR